LIGRQKTWIIPRWEPLFKFQLKGNIICLILNLTSKVNFLNLDEGKKVFLSIQSKDKKIQGLESYEKKNFNSYGGCVVEYVLFGMHDGSGGVIQHKTRTEFLRGEINERKIGHDGIYAYGENARGRW